MSPRTPDRIEPLLERLKEAWQLEPDWRFGQLVFNLLHIEQPVPDMFSLEDRRWQRRIDKFIAEHASRK